ncbi:MAG: endonuclease/exonuclease/phosphatase family protein [Prevotella sp.]|nr:endonuclease/exonuclease/phosphatase family protein [Prevotella sp.]
MGKQAVYKYISFMILVISTLLAIFTLFGLFGGSVNPATGTAMAMLVYVLPYLLIGNAVMLIYRLIRRDWIWLSISAVPLLCSIPYIGTIYQTGLFNSTPNSTGIKIATYNVEAFGREISGFKAEDILTEMKKQGVDIFCIQEYNEASGNKKNSDSYKTYFPYMAMGRNDMAIYSRYPLEASEIIDFGRTNNSGMWADVNVNGQKIRIFNVHLETTGFNRTLHNIAKQEVQGTKIENNAIIKAIYGNYTRGMAVRAQQADQVAREIKHSDIPVIVCGDFNDVPYSYVYKTMLGELVDGFKECGKGFMYTMRERKFKVRIDYIFHSEELKGETYYREKLNYSDHYPVFMKIAL